MCIYGKERQKLGWALVLTSLIRVLQDYHNVNGTFMIYERYALSSFSASFSAFSHCTSQTKEPAVIVLNTETINNDFIRPITDDMIPEMTSNDFCSISFLQSFFRLLSRTHFFFFIDETFGFWFPESANLTSMFTLLTCVSISIPYSFFSTQNNQGICAHTFTYSLSLSCALILLLSIVTG